VTNIHGRLPAAQEDYDELFDRYAEEEEEPNQPQDHDHADYPVPHQGRREVW
jgi:hypothetical protein